jgi:endonuclease III
LEPFDLKDAPLCLNSVDKLMDLSTVHRNLASGLYSNQNDFFVDADLCFTNAITYHSDKKQTKWIVTHANAMLEISKKLKSDTADQLTKSVTETSKKKTRQKPKGPQQEVSALPTPPGVAKNQGSESPGKGKAARKKQKINTAVQATETTKMHASMMVSLPIDNNTETWERFVDAKGYNITEDQKVLVKAWVRSLDKNWIAEEVKFFNVIHDMRSQLQPTPRDGWKSVLPDPNKENFEFCCLMLMVTTPNVPDVNIIKVFGPLFRDNHVDANWVLRQGETKLRAALTSLGRQNDSARYMMGIAAAWKGLPRDYRRAQDYIGVGPKVALVAIDECFGLAQGVPCDIHMVRMFQILGWMPPRTSYQQSWTATDEKDYELARAAIEGWFPSNRWGELNRTWAGLGQIFREDDRTDELAAWVDKERLRHTSNLRDSDAKRLDLIHSVYQQRKNKKK